MTTGSTLSGVRWSGLVHSRCARRVFFEHTDAPADRPTDEDRQRWARGHRYEQIIAEEVVAELAANGIPAERQTVLDWPNSDHPIGQTHVDIVAPTGDAIRVVEIKSNAGAELQEHAAIQVAGQALLLREQTAISAPDDGFARAVEHDIDAIVVCVDSHTGARRDHRIDIDHYEGVVEELWQLARAGVDATIDCEPPDRVADYPSDQRCQFCPFRSTCWEGWEPPELDQVIGMETVADELAGVDAELRLANERAKAITERRDALRDQLRPYLPANEKVGVGAHTIRLTVFDATTFKLGEATTAGLTLPSDFDPYVTRGTREKWTVK